MIFKCKSQISSRVVPLALKHSKNAHLKQNKQLKTAIFISLKTLEKLKISKQ